MPITLNCPKCHKPFRVRDESIGGRVRCPSCGSVLQVPSALSPASNFGDDPKREAGSHAGTHRPVAEDVPAGASRAGTADDAVDLNAPAGAAHAGPPSIRMPSAPPPPPPRAPVQLPPGPQPADRPRTVPVRLPAADEPGWMRVHGGLGMIRWAMFLCALVFFGAFAHGAWFVTDPDGAMKPGPGFLGIQGWPRWKEIAVAYTAGPLALAALLLLFGRLRCGRAPAEANARSLALGAGLFTLVALAAVVLFGGMTYFELGEKLHLPPVVRPVAMIAIVPAGFLADVLTLLFIGQIGWPLRRPGLQKAVASLFLYVALVPAGILIGHLFYPVWETAVDSWRQTGTPLGAGDETEQARRVLIWAVIVLAAGLLFCLRYASVAGAGRRAIRRYLAGEA